MAKLTRDSKTDADHIARAPRAVVKLHEDRKVLDEMAAIKRQRGIDRQTLEQPKKDATPVI